MCEMVTGGVEMLDRRLARRAVRAGRHGRPRRHLRRGVRRRDVPRPAVRRDEARRMLHELKGFKLLEGVRGAKPADVDALVDTIMNVQRLALDLADDVRELDINPLVVRPRGAVALDALVVKQVTAEPLPEGVNVDEELVADARERRALAHDQPRRQGQRDPLLRARPAHRSTSATRTATSTCARSCSPRAGERHFCTGADLSVPPARRAAASPTARPTCVVGGAISMMRARLPAADAGDLRTARSRSSSR